MNICKIRDIYVVGIPHVIKGYLQNVVVVYKKGESWIVQIAEHYRTNDKDLSTLLKELMFATTEGDFEEGVGRAITKGIKVERIEENKNKWNLPFPKNLIEGKVKLQKEVD
ncbi:hypothetical protein [Sulfuracidifex metallicus]|uniref:hypothetical protein n=1 Tax=Sulfuracidifex metallicus TaxID=47303 RepID=UPI00227676B3|nr:hypothetical protein [Sulfuracidifex metallicus]MCY0849850.1 hypothetical protein [Sulfuracidifex metallicus]